MNDRQLRSFLLAAEQKSFSKAADVSFISTPALVQQINLLEKSVGFRLFERMPRGVTLTPAGEHFYTAAKEILHLYDKACERGRDIETNAGATLRIACPDEQFPGFFFEATSLFMKMLPQVNVSFLRIPFTKHLEAIRNGEADLTMIAQPGEEFLHQLTYTPLLDDVCAFCMRPEHPLAKYNVLTPELLHHINILCGRYPYMRVTFMDLLQGFGVRPCDAEYDSAIRSRVIISDDVFVIHAQWRTIYDSFLAVVPSAIPAGSIGIVSRKNPHPLVSRFIDVVKQTTMAL